MSFPKIGLCNAPNRAEFVFYEQVLGGLRTERVGDYGGNPRGYCEFGNITWKNLLTWKHNFLVRNITFNLEIFTLVWIDLNIQPDESLLGLLL